MHLLFNCPYCRKFLFKLPSTTPVLLRPKRRQNDVHPVLLSTTSSTTSYYKVLPHTTKYYSSTTPYYKRTTKYYSSTTPYYDVLLQYYSVLQTYCSVLQSTTPTETTSERRPSSTTPYYKVLLQYCFVLQSTTPVLQSTTPVLLLTTKYYSVLQSTTFDRNDVRTTSIQYYSVLLKYYSSTASYYKVLLRTTKYYSMYYSWLQSTILYYKVLLRPKRRQNDVHPVLLRTTKYYSSTTKYYSSTTPYYKVLLQYYKVLLCTAKYYSSTTPYYKRTTPVLLRTTKYYSSTTKYYSVLQSTTPVLLRPKRRQNDVHPVLFRTTKYYSSTTSTETTSERRPSSTTPYYKVLLQYYKVLPRTTKYYSSTTPYYKVLLQYYSVLQTYYKVLLRTTEYYSSTTPYYKVVQKLPKRAFRARLPQLFKEQASKTSISCETSSTFQRTSFQNEYFVRDFRNFSSDKLPKRAFRARLPPLFKAEASKTSISCETSSTFQGTSFQNEHFVRGFLNFSKNKLPKRAFRARLPQLFNQGASKVLRLPRKTRKWPPTLKVWSVKTSISCETSCKFHTFNSKIIDDFVRVFLIKPFLQSSKSMTFAKLPPLFKTITKSCACHDICSSVTFARHCHCDSWKQHLRHVTKCCACHDIAKGHITKCCACHEKTTRLHWLASKVLRLSRKTRKWPHILWLGSAKTSISCETSSTFQTLKDRMVSQCECTAQWQRINELATSWRRRRDDEATTTEQNNANTGPTPDPNYKREPFATHSGTKDTVFLPKTRRQQNPTNMMRCPNVCFHWYVYQRLPCQVPGAPNGTDWNLAHNVADQRPKAHKKMGGIFFTTWWGRCGKDEDDSLCSIS